MPPMNRPPTTPGEMLLEEYLKPRGISQVELATRMDVPVQCVNTIVNGKRGITAETAILLSEALDTTRSSGWGCRPTTICGTRSASERPRRTGAPPPPRVDAAHGRAGSRSGGRALEATVADFADIRAWRAQVADEGVGDHLDPTLAQQLVPRLLDEVEVLLQELASSRRGFAQKAAGALAKRLQDVAAFNHGGCPQCRDAEARAFLARLQRAGAEY